MKKYVYSPIDEMGVEKKRFSVNRLVRIEVFPKLTVTTKSQNLLLFPCSHYFVSLL